MNTLYRHGKKAKGHTTLWKKMTLLLIINLLNINAGNASTINTFMIDLLPTPRDYVYEVQTDKFEKVILDCSSFITGLVFYNNNKEEYNFYLNGYECQEMYNFLFDSITSKKAVCFEIEHQKNQLTISRKNKMECQ
jgi:hypothetical protein